MAKAKQVDLQTWAERASKLIQGLARKLKSSEVENAKLKESSERAKATLKSAVEAGEKLLLVLVAVGTITLTLYYLPKHNTVEVAANPPAHFLLSLAA